MVIDKDIKLSSIKTKIWGIFLFLVTIFVFNSPLKPFDLKKIATYINILGLIILPVCTICLLTYYFYYNSNYITCGFLFFRSKIDLKSVTAITSFQLGLVHIFYDGKVCAVPLLPKKTSKTMNDFLLFIKSEYPHIVIDVD